MSDAAAPWQRVCALEDVPRGAGACVLVQGRQVALFRVARRVYALDNFDPAGGAQVLARGIVGELRGERVVASPLYKHHYSLATGRCLEDPQQAVAVHPTRVSGGAIWVRLTNRTAGPGSPRRATA